jgi:hypothetical protein
MKNYQNSNLSNTYKMTEIMIQIQIQMMMEKILMRLMNKKLILNVSMEKLNSAIVKSQIKFKI